MKRVMTIQDWFDESFYLEDNPDVAAAGVDPWAHFRDFGHAEGRLPRPGSPLLRHALRARRTRSRTPLADLLALFPDSARQRVWDHDVWDRLTRLFQPTTYLAQLDPQQRAPDLQPLEHFLAQGAFAGLRPTLFFNAEWYRQRIEGQNIAGRSPTTLADGSSPLFHWLALGWDAGIIPTPLFDSDYYSARHADLSSWNGWLFSHFLFHGSKEAFRRPTPFVEARPAAHGEKPTDVTSEFLQAAADREKAAGSPEPFVLGPSSRFEDDTAFLCRRSRILQDEHVLRIVARAATIEPLVARASAKRVVQLPPIKHGLMPVVRAGESIRKTIGMTSADTIVLAPHCRMAGSARLTGQFVRAVIAERPDESLILVTTDLPDFERPDWFGPSVRHFDASTPMLDVASERRHMVLLDLIRGLSPKRVVNINSRLGWHLYELHGRQLHRETDLFAYLFTWDLDRNGHKGGYPITFFQNCFSNLAGVFFDNAPLRDELSARYLMPRRLNDRLHLLHTPADPSDKDWSDLFEKRRSRQDAPPLRAIWAGRFDRQKRFDIVVEIARRMPELEILAWGREILGESGVDFDNLPGNIRLQGTYADFDDLPVGSCDFFLYTSQWDGLPTILIDAGSRGIPIVASRVGGTGDLISDDTAYPVDDVLAPDAYVDAIRSMLADPAEVTRRSRRLRDFTRNLCNAAAYGTSISRAFESGSLRDQAE